MMHIHVGHAQECRGVTLRISISCDHSDYDVHMHVRMSTQSGLAVEDRIKDTMND